MEDFGSDTSVFSIQVQLASDIDPSAPGTVGIVTWSINAELASAEIEFGLDTDYGMKAPVDLQEKDYRTLLLGMKPNRLYHFRIAAETADTMLFSEDYTLKTGPATNLVSLDRFDIIAPNKHESGFIVTAFYQTDLTHDGISDGSVAFILDPDGEVVWWYQTYATSVVRARMSADGKNMWISTLDLEGGLERVTMDTLDSEIFDVGQAPDITPVDNDLMAYIDYSEPDCASIFEIDLSGRTTEIFESEGLIPLGYCRGNALRYSQSEDVYTFSEHRHDIYVIDRSGEITWRLSDIASESWGGDQHGHQLLHDSFLLYANSGSSNGSTATEYRLNDGARIMQYDVGYSTYNLGDVQRLPNGNTLVTYSVAGVIHEVSTDGERVSEINMGTPLGYTSWRSRLYGPPSDIQQ